MNTKTRYLQLTDVIMLEYRMLGENDPSEFNMSEVYYTELSDGHSALFSPASYECEYDQDKECYKKLANPITLNTINHLAVPKNINAIEWYSFADPDYRYEDGLLNPVMPEDQIKVEQYKKYIPYAEGFKKVSATARFDSLRLYFVNGYDFSNIYGMLARIVLSGKNEDYSDKYIDLCNFFFNRDNAYKLVSYMTSPILFGNDIYDKYIEINLPCFYDLKMNTSSALHDLVNVDDTTNIKLQFSIVNEDGVTVSSIERSINEIVNLSDDENVNISFIRDYVLKGSIPSENIISDNLGCYISEIPDKPYVEFYATWKDEPLTSDVVWRFNKTIPLYDRSLMRRESEYEVSDNYEVEHSERKWMAIHELKLSFLMGDTVVKTETYNMNQIFISNDDQYKFYYRPLIFDDAKGLYIDNIQIVYTMRFINMDDKVQFIKTATIGLVDNMGRFFEKSTNLKFSDVAPFKVFTKIVDNNTTLNIENKGIQAVRYTNVYYDTTNVVIDDNQGNTYGQYGYTLNVSQAPKTYKFIFKRMDDEGRYSYMDLTGSYYKLMFKDASGETNLIEPTYSRNMNMLLGEIEFNLSVENINKLSDVPETERRMSIVSYNDNNYVSSMFDFLYTM